MLKKKLEDKRSNITLDNEISIFTNQIIKRITQNLENFHYNVIIANFHEIYNFFSKIKSDQSLNYKSLKENYIKILIVMKPVLPHLVSECLLNLDAKNTSIWPEIDERFLEQKTVNIVIQVNGKKRSVANCDKDIVEKKLIEIVNEKDEMKKYLENKKIIKSIYVKNKIINLIVK